MDEKEEGFLKILDRHANGETIRGICKDAGLPSRKSFMEWSQKEENREAYQRSRELFADHHFEDIIARAHRVEHAEDMVDVHRQTKAIDTLKWVVCKSLPKKYGERVSTEVSGPDGKALGAIVPVINVKLSNDQSDAS